MRSTIIPYSTFLRIAHSFDNDEVCQGTISSHLFRRLINGQRHQLWDWDLLFLQHLDSDKSDSSKAMDNFILALVQMAGGSLENPLEGSTSPSRISSTPLHSRSVPTLSIINRRTAHSAIMDVVSVTLFPSFALTLYIIPSSKTVPLVHAPLQILTLGLAIAGFYFGVTLATALGLSSAYHPITGYVVISCLILFQPAMRLLQHLHYR